MSKANLDDILGTNADDNNESTKSADDTKQTEAKSTESSDDKPKATKSTVKKEDKGANDKKDDAKAAVKLKETSKADNIDDTSNDTKTEVKASSSNEIKKAEEDNNLEPVKVDDAQQDESSNKNNNETETSISTQSMFPYTLALIKPVVIYRGASLNLAGKSYGGTVTVLGGDVNGFTPIEFVRSGLGLSNGYILTREVEVCKSSR